MVYLINTWPLKQIRLRYWVLRRMLKKNQIQTIWILIEAPNAIAAQHSIVNNPLLHYYAEEEQP